ncbi:hypothetical protein M885DRAFT_626368 [Pelagophyceae sp. CCMP2097]|nr:hypothetical protein M885DRAFT_626368 [Pelagophyceae sp. CCMP2097]|mmetsp:Transcript_15857/g.53431  ORF Transcript_15857/g.53431 Transcript_15857/m.53431 type:complete len:203 (-) Transcript_15857:150-758(-)
MGVGDDGPARPTTTGSKPCVLNYSFMDISDVGDVSSKRSLAAPPRDAYDGPRRRARCACVRLANNRIALLEGDTPIAAALAEVVHDVSALRWVDLSFNSISHVGAAFQPFSGLAVLYLHANGISDFREVKHLSKLTSLRSLTLHGNPIEDKKMYRTYIVHTIQSLTQLDFSTITKQDRERADAWALTFRHKLAGKPREVEPF